MARRTPRRFSDVFRLAKTQSELDFVDVFLNTDNPLFIDPYALAKRCDPWSIEASNLVVDFFETAIRAIREGDEEQAQHLLSHLGEPNDTRLGMSRGSPRGRGVGEVQSRELFEKLKDSTAVRTGFLRDLEDCELFIPGISADKISDATTNIIRLKLAHYTQAQCNLHDVPVENVSSGRHWDDHTHSWVPDDYLALPVHRHKRILLLPKAIARTSLSFDHRDYYTHYVLDYLQAEHLRTNSGLVQLLKNGKRRVTKKSLRSQVRGDKESLYEFSKEHPDVLEDYKAHPRQGKPAEVSDPNEIAALRGKLASIPTGAAAASAFHDAVKGILEAIFFPDLIHPRKEQEVHQGRKRIDISFTNDARRGFFNWLPNVKKIPCPFIHFECKNYTDDPNNPELDQLAGRFSPNRGQFGVLVCRECADRELFRQRCRDTVNDQRGYIIMLTDDDLEQLIEFRVRDDVRGIDELLHEEFRGIVF